MSTGFSRVGLRWPARDNLEDVVDLLAGVLVILKVSSLPFSFCKVYSKSLCPMKRSLCPACYSLVIERNTQVFFVCEFKGPMS